VLDGNHRLEAYKAEGVKQAPAIVMPDTNKTMKWIQDQDEKELDQQAADYLKKQGRGK
jgi:ParB-like chromosome segregation protein Spo0J